MPVYCSYTNWLAHQKDRSYQDVLNTLCINEIKCNTFIMPDSGLVKKLISMSTGTKEKRRECLKTVLAMMLQINVSDRNFKPGTYKNNLGQSVKISAPSNGKFTIMSGKGFSTKCEIKINTSFEPDLQFRSEGSEPQSRHMCVCDIVSGEIAIDGEAYTGVQSAKDVLMGGSEFVASEINTKLQAWEEIISSFEIELEHKTSLAEPQVRLCGLLKYIMLKSEEVSEYNHYADLVHTAICFEPLAALYILMQPYGSHQLLPTQVNEDWSFSPYVYDGNPKELFDQFCSKFPSKIDSAKRDEVIRSIKESQGINKLYDLQEVYEKCNELFSVINYPCEMKLWCDEVCFYICQHMKEIRRNYNVTGFRELCDNLQRIYPGKDHKAESIINHEDYWNGFDKSKEIKGVSDFVDSFCCFQHCCCCDKGTLASNCASTLVTTKPSKFLKNLIYLNQ